MVTKQEEFKLQFQEQVDFLQQKIRLPTLTYRDLNSRQHDRAFVVAGAMKADLLNDLHHAVNKAVADGQSFKQFQDGFDDILGKHGWLNDADKEYKAWRATVIYQTNMRTSHAAGRYKQMTDPEVLKRRPYWRYIHNTVENPRVQHQRWDGLVLPADAQFWQINFPPNGYGCKCNVAAINERQLKALGKSKADDEPSYDDKRKDFLSAPGASWHPDLNKYPEPIAKDYVAENMRDGVFERWINRMESQKDGMKQLGKFDQLSNVAKNKLIRQQNTGEKYPVAVMDALQKNLLGVSTNTVFLSEYDALKQTISREGNRGFTALSYQQVQKVIDGAVLIVRQMLTPSGESSQRTIWVEGFTDGKKSRYSAVLHQTADGKEVYLKSYRLDGTKDNAVRKRGEVLLDNEGNT